MRRIVFMVTFILLAGCGEATPGASTDTSTQSPDDASTTTASQAAGGEDFCSILHELDDAMNASLAAAFGQGFDGPELTPDQVEEGFARLRQVEQRLGDSAPADAPAALDRYISIHADYMDVIEENGYVPDPDTLDPTDRRVRVWNDSGTRALEAQVADYLESTCRG